MGSLISGFSRELSKETLTQTDRRSHSPKNCKTLRRKFACWPHCLTGSKNLLEGTATIKKGAAHAHPPLALATAWFLQKLGIKLSGSLGPSGCPYAAQLCQCQREKGKRLRKAASMDQPIRNKLINLFRWFTLIFLVHTDTTHLSTFRETRPFISLSNASCHSLASDRDIASA